MQLRPDRPEHDVWFIYSRRPGKISATPVSAMGWAALAGCVSATLILGMAVGGWAAAIHPIFGFLALMSVTTIGVLLTVRLAIAKGKRID